ESELGRRELRMQPIGAPRREEREEEASAAGTRRDSGAERATAEADVGRSASIIEGAMPNRKPQPLVTAADRKRLVAVRRDLHRHPELAFRETRTAGIAAARLRELGYRPKTGIGVTGVVADRTRRAEAPRVLIRADMDALPIDE